MRVGSKRLVLLLLCVAFTVLACSDTSGFSGRGETPPDHPLPPQYPLSVSSNGRYLQDVTGRAVLLNGDASWSLGARGTREDIDLYLADRSARGFNAIYVNAIESEFSDNPPRNVYGDAPFTGALESGEPDFSTPAEAYWEHIDYLLRAAEEQGIVVLLFPAYVGFQHAREGWAATIAANGVNRMVSYGRFLGERYGEQSNVIWMMGGDWGPVWEDSDLTAEINALAVALRAAQGDQLISAHSNRGRSALNDYNRSWLDFNTAYEYWHYPVPSESQTIPQVLRNEYQRSPAMPLLYIEGKYEGENEVSAAGLRAQAYWSITGGAFGHFFGNHPIWFLGYAEEYFGHLYDGPERSWQEALDSQGSREMSHVGALLRARPFERLVPDYDDTLVIAGKGAIGAIDYVSAAVADDSTFLAAYLPEGREITIDVGRLLGDTIAAWWVDPRSGDVIAINAAADEAGALTVVPENTNDWILLIDSESAGYPALRL